MRIVKVAAAAVLSIGMSAALLTVASPANAATRTSVNNCGQLEVKPTDLVLACADANSMLTELKWSGWSNGRAKGIGVYEVNDCTPTCVAGTTRSFTVRVKLDQPKVQAGTRVFTRVVVAYPRKSPTGKKFGVWRLPSLTATTPTTSPSPSVSATPSATPAPTASASATPTAAASATALAKVGPPSAVIQKSEIFQTSKVRLTVAASSTGGGDRRGIKSVTVYRANEEGAELPTKASYIGAETADQNEWQALIGCDRSGREKDALRIVVTANDGQSTTLREAIKPSTC